MKVYVEQHPNKECRTFHVSKNFQENNPKLWVSESYTEDRAASTEVLDLYAKLIALNEVQSISISKNNISVVCNRVWTWEEIIPVIIQHIETFFNDRVEIVTIQPREEWMDKPPRDDGF